MENWYYILHITYYLSRTKCEALNWDIEAQKKKKEEKRIINNLQWKIWHWIGLTRALNIWRGLRAAVTTSKAGTRGYKNDEHPSSRVSVSQYLAVSDNSFHRFLKTFWQARFFFDVPNRKFPKINYLVSFTNPLNRTRRRIWWKRRRWRRILGRLRHWTVISLKCHKVWLVFWFCIRVKCCRFHGLKKKKALK